MHTCIHVHRGRNIFRNLGNFLVGLNIVKDNLSKGDIRKYNKIKTHELKSVLIC